MHIEDSRNETSSVKKMKSVRIQKAKADLKGRTVKQRKNFGIFSFFTGAGFIDLFAVCGGLRTQFDKLENA